MVQLSAITTRIRCADQNGGEDVCQGWKRSGSVYGTCNNTFQRCSDGAAEGMAPIRANALATRISHTAIHSNFTRLQAINELHNE